MADLLAMDVSQISQEVMLDDADSLGKDFETLLPEEAQNYKQFKSQLFTTFKEVLDDKLKPALVQLAEIRKKEEAEAARLKGKRRKIEEDATSPAAASASEGSDSCPSLGR